MYEYLLAGFGSMIDHNNRHRVAAYQQAMATAIRPGSVVLEIGTGLGFFAMYACQLGARHVYAVEPNPLIHLGKEIAAANGFAKQITFINDMSQAISLPESADVVISDLRGSLPWLADHIPTIQDARTRLLKPSGVQIPTHDTVWAAVVHAPEAYQNRLGAWDKNPFDLDLSLARKRIVNTIGKSRIKTTSLLTEPICWADLDYRTLNETNASGDLQWTIAQAGKAHGLSMWFVSELVPTVVLSNAPDQPHNPVYSQTFFPFEQPIDLDIEDKIQIDIQTKRMGNQYIWVWNTNVQTHLGVEKANFKQSSFWSLNWGDLRVNRLSA